MLAKRYAWKCLAALIGAAMPGIWTPEAMGQAGTEEAPAEAMRAIRPKPLEIIPLEMPSQELVEAPEPFHVFIIPEELPELIGGMERLFRSIRYPESARKDGVEGRVFVSFVVNKRGRVEDAVVRRGIGGGCDEEALRVIRRARFKPGADTYRKPNGDLARKVVDVHMSLPITFRLSPAERRRVARR